MSQFAVVRHPETGGVGTAPADAMEHLRTLGWIRVSDYAAEPSAFHLPDFAEATTDLDAPEPEQDTRPRRRPAADDKESTE